MTNPTAAVEQARHLVDLHTRDIICPRLVWDGFVPQVTAEIFPQFMAELTPALHSYFRDVVLTLNASNEAEARALGWLVAYYEDHAN